MGVLPLVVEQDVARQRLDLRSALAEPRSMVIDAGVHDSPTRDEAASRSKIFADAGQNIAQAEPLAVAGEYSFPERRIAHYPARLVEAARRLE